MKDSRPIFPPQNTEKALDKEKIGTFIPEEEKTPAN